MIQRDPPGDRKPGDFEPSLRRVLRDQVLLEVERQTNLPLEKIEQYLEQFELTKDDVCAFLVDMDRIGNDPFQCFKSAVEGSVDPNENGYLARLRALSSKR